MADTTDKKSVQKKRGRISNEEKQRIAAEKQAVIDNPHESAGKKLIALQDRAIRDLTRKDIRLIGENTSREEVRELVNYYYRVQDQRIRFGNQISAHQREAEKSGIPATPNALLHIFFNEQAAAEKLIRDALFDYVNSDKIGVAVMKVYGMGPVLTAGLLAELDITKMQTAGSLWRFAGLDPTVTWEKGQKRPWNAALKRLAYLIGASFIKFQNKEECFYGKLYQERKALLTKQNENFQFADYAKKALPKFKVGTASHTAYGQGKLPDHQIVARARRHAVKIFLSHLFDVMYIDHHKKPSPVPYAIAHLNHVHIIENFIPFEQAPEYEIALEDVEKTERDEITGFLGNDDDDCGINPADMK